MLADLADGIGDLVRQHIALARHELVADLKGMGRGVAILGQMGVVILVGYVLAVIGAGFALASVLGLALGFVTLGVLHLVIGGLGIRWALSRLRAVRLGDETGTALKRTAGVLVNGAESGNRDQRPATRISAH